MAFQFLKHCVRESTKQPTPINRMFINDDDGGGGVGALTARSKLITPPSKGLSIDESGQQLMPRR